MKFEIVDASVMRDSGRPSLYPDLIEAIVNLPVGKAVRVQVPEGKSVDAFVGSVKAAMKRSGIKIKLRTNKIDDRHVLFAQRNGEEA